MMAVLMMAAAAQGPVLLARNDEAQWRMFVRASVESRPAPPRGATSRMREIEDALRGLSDRRGTAPSPKGPTGL